MKVGDIIFPKRKHNRSGQLHIPFWSTEPALIIDLVHYSAVEDDTDCQSDDIDDMRWLVLQDGNLLYFTTFLLEQLYESR